MLGVPEGERQQIRHWLDASLAPRAGPDRAEPRERAGRRRDRDVLASSSRARSASNPGDDMLSRLTQVTVDRGDGEETGLDDIEIAGFATLLGGAGAETVTKLVGNAVVLFARHPDQWQKILDDPAKIPRAVDEILRVLAAVAVPGAVLRAGAHARGRHDSGRIPGAPHHRRGDPRPARVRARRRLRHRAATGHHHRVRSRGAQLPRRRAGAPGEPHRDRRARRPLAATRGRRGRTASRAHDATSRAIRTSPSAPCADVPIVDRGATNMLRNPDHVTVAVADAATAIEFFALLGFREGARRHDRRRRTRAVHGHARHEGAAHHARARRSRTPLRDPAARVRTDARRRSGRAPDQPATTGLQPPRVPCRRHRRGRRRTSSPTA